MPPIVFISYSHEDEVWKDRLVKHLAGLERDGRLRTWDDRDIRAGQAWLPEIEAALQQTRVAVLLVSPDFLASEFIQTREVPALLARQGVHIVPLIVRDCLWEEEVRISNLQARPRDGRPLANYRSDRRDTELKEIAREILELLRDVQIGRDGSGNVTLTGDATVTILQATRVLEPAVTAPGLIGANPYKGLSAFQEEDADRFFGREDMVRELWEELRPLGEPSPSTAPGTNPPVRLFTVQGPSGSGKSSLVRAGLLPELARRPLWGLGALRVAPVVPGAHPVDALALALARLVTGDAAPVAKAREFAGELGVPGEQGRRDGLRRIAGGSPLLVFVDQFEEVYTLSSAKERDIFVDNLLDAAADRGGAVTVLLTLRNDFLPRTRHNEKLHEIVTRQNLFVRYLREEELRRAIAEPARRAGHPLDDGTIELLVQETRGEEQALPALQFTLTRIWEGMSNGVPPAQTYREIGGVGGSLAQEAQRLYDSLPDSDRLIARRSFLRMVRIGYDIRDTARKVDLDEIVAHGEDREHVKAVLERFARPEARIITLAAELDGTITARLTHEALLDRWKRFDEWLTPGVREDLLFHYRLEEEARYWHRRGRPDDLLWPKNDAERLRAYERRNGRDMTALQKAFYYASDPQSDNGEKERRPSWRALLKTDAKLRLATALAAGLLASTLGLYGWLYLDSRKAEPEKKNLSVIADPARPPDDSLGIPEPTPAQPADVDTQPQQQIRQLVGVGSLEMSGSVSVAIVGIPSRSSPIADPKEILGSDSANSDDGMAAYVSMLAHTVRLIAPRARLIFFPVSSGSTFRKPLEDILAYPQASAVVLAPYATMEQESKVLERIAARGSTVVLAAGNEVDHPADFSGMAVGKKLLIVAASDLQGKISSFSSRGPHVVWAPGEGIPLPMELRRRFSDDTIQGTGPAAAVAAGVVARVLNAYPGLPPAKVIDVLRRTSRKTRPDGAPVINLDAALAELARQTPPP